MLLKSIHYANLLCLHRHEGISNVGKEGYEGMVRKLRERIIDGDFIQVLILIFCKTWRISMLISTTCQVVPSQRIARKIGVHPFNVYQQLRKLNPSRYTFYVDCEDFQLGIVLSVSTMH